VNLRPGCLVRFSERAGARGKDGKVKAIEGDVVHLWANEYGGMWSGLRAVPRSRITRVVREAS